MSNENAQNDANNKRAIDFFDESISFFESITHSIENMAYMTDEIRSSIVDSICVLNDMIYGSAISSFWKTIIGCLDKRDFALIENLYKKWKETESSATKIDDQIFEDFQVDLRLFTHDNPYFSSDDKTVIWLFEKIWRTYFEDRALRVRNICTDMKLIASSKEDRIVFLVGTRFSTISPFDFEELVGGLFVKMGYNTEVTKKTCDYGIDIVAKSNNDVIAIQVKKYSSGNNVGNRDIQMLLGAMQLSRVKANKSLLITTSDFTLQAIEQAKENPIELWNGEYISELFLKYGV